MGTKTSPLNTVALKLSHQLHLSPKLILLFVLGRFAQVVEGEDDHEEEETAAQVHPQGEEAQRAVPQGSGVSEAGHLAPGLPSGSPPHHFHPRQEFPPGAGSNLMMFF